MSPSKQVKPKISEQATASTQFLKTSTQETFRKAASNKDRKKKENKDPLCQLLNFSEPEEYIFLDNNFLCMAPKDLSAIEGKLLSHRDIVYDNKLSSNCPKNQRYQEPTPEYSEAEKIFEDYL